MFYCRRYSCTAGSRTSASPSLCGCWLRCGVMWIEDWILSKGHGFDQQWSNVSSSLSKPILISTMFAISSLICLWSSPSISGFFWRPKECSSFLHMPLISACGWSDPSLLLTYLGTSLEDLVLCHAPDPILISAVSEEATEQPAHLEVISFHGGVGSICLKPTYYFPGWQINSRAVCCAH